MEPTTNEPSVSTPSMPNPEEVQPMPEATPEVVVEEEGKPVGPATVMGDEPVDQFPAEVIPEGTDAQ